MTFVRRKVDVTFRLGQGSFGESGFNTVTESGLRCSAEIVRGGGVSFNVLNMRIWGMKLETMNQLVTLGQPISRLRRNQITVSAGDDSTGMSVVFIGDIWNAWVDPNNMPEVSLIVTAYTGIIDAMRPVPAISYNGNVDVSVVMAGFAKLGGYGFENDGVSVHLASPYFDGTLIDMIQAAARAADINAVIDDNTLAIWPKNGDRGGSVPLISADTGLIGYPAFTQMGIAFETQYNPAIKFNGRVQVKSDLQPVNGLWVPYFVSHRLDAEMPGGQWITRCECVAVGEAIPIQ